MPTVCMPPVATSRSAMRSATFIQRRKFQRLSGDALAARIWMLACIFSQMRGTPRKIVGWASCRFCVTVSIDSAKFTTHPAARLNHTVKMRSAI